MSYLGNGDGVVFASHSEQVYTSGQDCVRFYLNRLDISDTENPIWLPQINVPGTPVYYSEKTGRLVTVDYKRVRISGISEEECISGRDDRGVSYQTKGRVCTYLTYALMRLMVRDDRAVLLEQLDLGDMTMLDRAISTEEAVFIVSPYTYTYNATTGVNDTIPPRLTAVSATDVTGFVPLGDLTLPTVYSCMIAAKGDTAVVVDPYPPTAQIVDATPSGSLASKEVDLNGYSYELSLNDDYLISANGIRGVQAIPLDD
jgi:hypothetical protein